MKILCISGSASRDSSNVKFLKAIAEHLSDKHTAEVYEGLYRFPLFTTERLNAGMPEIINLLRDRITQADLVLISTPEYNHNIPAVLKNMLEWITDSGELFGKRVLPITFTPKAPRGEHALISLQMSLKAQQASIISEANFYKTDVEFVDDLIVLPEDIKLMFDGLLEI
ncbi:NADPH-dependent FMN reductase [Psychroflexus sediminis]|uniref:NAD(P)H-dependent FMN reductase n=1 Tax=Psychroflexus sediminis TaxID=470826 RepID=A0A1G7V767_9FLAO|nr:NAD(P)H-dependent oxidoreductase [Psychroflexus sediminis]SDG55603.1 NAD(P)H-dependent FMN reductase [Psychroflexus sediminis]